jgi:hypothetical protein
VRVTESRQATKTVTILRLYQKQIISINLVYLGLAMPVLLVEIVEFSIEL